MRLNPLTLFSFVHLEQHQSFLKSNRPQAEKKRKKIAPFSTPLMRCAVAGDNVNNPPSLSCLQIPNSSLGTTGTFRDYIRLVITVQYTSGGEGEEIPFRSGIRGRAIQMGSRGPLF